VNGVPSCANDWLLREKLRGEWQFNGYVTSDCDADSDVFYSHHYSATPEQAVADVLRCGSRRSRVLTVTRRQGRHRRRLRLVRAQVRTERSGQRRCKRD
jgi:beta-glucosidase-like glycosyl hydrolase